MEFTRSNFGEMVNFLETDEGIKQIIFRLLYYYFNEAGNPAEATKKEFEKVLKALGGEGILLLDGRFTAIIDRDDNTGVLRIADVKETVE